MALSNPYKIDEDENKVHGSFETLDLDDINERLPSDVRLQRVHECDCGNREYTSTVKKGDKWHLRYCGNCAGVYGWHDRRADYY